MIDNSLDTLDDYFREEYVEPFLSELMRQRLYVVVIETARTEARQQQLFEAGKSKTTFGFHCNGQAIDLAPVAFYDGEVDYINWSPQNPAWAKMGDIGKSHGLVWGGDWVSFPDKQHFQEPGPLKLEEPTLSRAELEALYEPSLTLAVANAGLPQGSN